MKPYVFLLAGTAVAALLLGTTSSTQFDPVDASSDATADVVAAAAASGQCSHPITSPGETADIVLVDHTRTECSLPPDTGPCRGFFVRWFYNPLTNLCLPFIYGGCQGNRNNFATQALCMSHCATTMSPTSDVPSSSPDTWLTLATRPAANLIS